MIDISHAPSLQSLAELAVRELDLPGVSVAFLEGSKVSVGTYGFLDEEGKLPYSPSAIFRIGCIVKLFMTVQVLKLVDEGRVRLDAPVHRSAPALAAARDPWLRLITVEHLLNHTSGLPSDVPGLSLDSRPDVLGSNNSVERLLELDQTGELGLLSKPGAYFSYSSLGFALVARVIEHCRGGVWLDDLTASVLQPLAIDCPQLRPEPTARRFALQGKRMARGATSFESAIPSKILPAEGGALALTPVDLLKLARMILSGGVSSTGERVLSADVARLAYSDPVALPGPSAYLHGCASGWFCHEDGTIGLNGDGIGNHVFFRCAPDQDAALSIGANFHPGTAVFRKIYSILFGDRQKVAVVPPAALHPRRDFSLEEGVGRYRHGAHVLTITRAARGLIARFESPAGPHDSPNVLESEVAHNGGPYFTVLRLPKFPDLWFLAASDAGPVEFLWNGIMLWKRISG